MMIWSVGFYVADIQCGLPVGDKFEGIFFLS